MPSDASPFSSDYQSARERFCTQALELEGKVVSHERQGGREGELFTDFVRFGSSQPRRLLVITSGLHGVEGFLGSAIQLNLLELLRAKQFNLNESGLLLVHALNPFGFARLRRFDEKNVDVNRNFLLADEQYSGSHAYYRRFDSFLNPKKWPNWELPISLQAFPKVMKYGFNNLQQAIAEGQYDFPLGLFFGGHEPSATMLHIEETLLAELETAELIIHLDIHSGLGKSGVSELLIDYQLTEPEVELLNNLFHNQVSSLDVEGSYQARGGFNRWIRHHVPHTISACWEFGTYGPLKMLSTLRAENAAYHWTDRSSQAFSKTKDQLKEAFCPASRKWRDIVIRDATDRLNIVINQWLLK